MYKSFKKKNKYISNKTNSKSRKSHKSGISQSFEQEITVIFLETLLMIKLFHWKTHSYATHKATDDFYTKFNEKLKISVCFNLVNC